MVDIDRAAKVVISESGVKELYNKLLIATGSRAFIPPIPGIRDADGRLKQGVFGFRSIDDCNAMIAYAKQSSRAAVIGGGLLGLEAARGLLTHDCEVHVIHLSEYLMKRSSTPGGAMLKAGMEKIGVNVLLGRARPKSSANNLVTGLVFKDGSTLACDMLVVAAGIRPNAEIGLRAGLTVERAIVTDDHMRSVNDADYLCCRRMRSAPRPSLRPRRSALGARQGLR